MSLVAFMIGALIPTLLVSRLILWLMRTWKGGVTRLCVAHTFSLAIAALIGGMGMADGGAFAGVAAAGTYLLPQAVWLAVDFIRLRRGRPGIPVPRLDRTE